MQGSSPKAISPPFTSQPESRANWKEMVGRVQMDRSMPLPSKSRSPLLWLRRWYRNSLLRLLLLEGIAIPRRIEWSRQIREVERLRGKDSIRQWMYQGQVPAVYADAYIGYIQQTENFHPLLSIRSEEHTSELQSL